MLVSRTHLFVNVKNHMHCAPLLVKPLIVSCVSSSTVPTSPLHEASASSPGIPKVVLKKGKAHLFRNGSPMVYSGAIDRMIGRPPPKTGDIVLVTDGSEKPIGWGLYNSFSMFSVRIMQLEDEVSRHPYCLFDMEKLLETRLGAAIKLRSVLGLPDEDTNAFRLVNSEGDRGLLHWLEGELLFFVKPVLLLIILSALPTWRVLILLTTCYGVVRKKATRSPCERMRSWTFSFALKAFLILWCTIYSRVN